jgi:hypothetical protein
VKQPLWTSSVLHFTQLAAQWIEVEPVMEMI